MNRRTVFANWKDKAAYLDGCAQLEATCAPIITLAAMFRSFPPATRARLIHQWVRDKIHYRRDPGLREEFADCPTILSRRYDDCDGKCRVFVALCIAAGLEARIRPIVRNLGTPQNEQFVHVQAEVRFPGSHEHPNATRANKSRDDGWIPAELILRGVPLGSGLEAAERDSSGQPVYA